MRSLSEMIGPKAFRVACSSSLVLGGLIGLLVATDLALKGHSQVVWMGALFLAVLLAFFVVLLIAVAYKRALRRSILGAAAVASDLRRLRDVLDRVDSSEEWLGTLRVEQLRESLRKQIDEWEQAV